MLRERDVEPLTLLIGVTAPSLPRINSERTPLMLIQRRLSSCETPGEQVSTSSPVERAQPWFVLARRRRSLLLELAVDLGQLAVRALQEVPHARQLLGLDSVSLFCCSLCAVTSRRTSRLPENAAAPVARAAREETSATRRKGRMVLEQERRVLVLPRGESLLRR